MALMVEAAELAELMQWKTEKESYDLRKDKVKNEIADVLIFSLILCDKYDLDFEKIIVEKIAINEKKYPIEKAKGSNKKYTDWHKE
jgi:NTP pyrophosphatase (non-canonical NTP hydrolase)